MHWLETSAIYHQPDYNKLGARVSAAWDVTGKGRTSARGWGVFTTLSRRKHVHGPSSFNSGCRSGTGLYRHPSSAPQSDFSAGLFCGALTQPSNPVYCPASLRSETVLAWISTFAVLPENYNLKSPQERTKQPGAKTLRRLAGNTSLFQFRDFNPPSHAQITASTGCKCINDGSVPGPLSTAEHISPTKKARPIRTINSLHKPASD